MERHHSYQPGRQDGLSPEGQELFEAIVRSVPIGVVVVDRNGAITFANPEAERQFGYALAELTGQPIEMLVPQHVRSSHAADRNAYHAHASPRAVGAGRYLTGLRKDGTEFPVEIGLTPFEDETGQMVMASVVDISVRMQAEREVIEREQRFRQVTENILEVFYLMDAQFRETIYINPAYETVWGRTCESLYRDPASFMEGVSPEDRDRLVASIAEVQRGVDPGEIEFSVTRPDGQVRRILAHAVPIRNEQGEVYRLAGVSLDITVRTRALDDLAASERRLRTLFETVNLIVLALDARGRVEYANAFFLKLTGYTSDDAVGADWFESFTPPALAGQERAIFEALLEGSGPEHYRSPVVTKAGDERMIAWHNTVVSDAEGRATGTLSIGEDITDVLRLEQQFQHAQKMEAVGRLAGGIAHDFNNVLTAISGYSHLLMDTFDDDDARREDVEAILDASGSAASLTRQLLTFSRQQVLEPRVLDLNEIVRGAEKMLRRVIGEDVELITTLAPDVAGVLADAGLIEQVLMNLVVNARDAMPRGGRLMLGTANAELTDTHEWEQFVTTPGSYVMLAVSDSGVGMDEATRARIFEPFFTTKEIGKGTGLGLATVYGIVKQSDGFIWVHSEPGLGATFKIYLPQVTDAPEPQPLPSTGKPTGGTETILLVEDAANVRIVARELLTRVGYTVLEAPDGGTALAIATRHRQPIHLLLTDVVMPGMSGRDVSEKLTKTREGLRVLFMSGYTDDAVTRAGVLHGVVNYLSKPFTSDALLRKVREVLDGP